MAGFIIGNLRDKITNIFGNKTKNNDILQDICDAIEIELQSHDVNSNIMKDITTCLTNKVKNDPRKDVNLQDKISMALYNTLLDIFKQTSNEIEIDPSKLNVVVLVGGYGVGKTLTTAKLATKFANNLKNVYVTSIDFNRDGGHEQLKFLINNNDIEYIPAKQSFNGIAMDIKNIIEECSDKTGILLIDTPAFDYKDSDKMTDMQNAINKNDVSECILVCDGTYGQMNLQICKAFSHYNFITGLCISKLDGMIGIGSIVNIRTSLLKNIYYTCDGEGIDDISNFNANLFVKSICQGLSLVNQPDCKTDCEVITIDDLVIYFNSKNNSKFETSYKNLIRRLSLEMTINEKYNPITLSYKRRKEIALACNIQVATLDSVITTFLKIKEKQKELPIKDLKISKLIYDDLITT